ncbi:MAG: glycogen/starch/alpha-glucan phosphorylase [Thermosphaera sp.]
MVIVSITPEIAIERGRTYAGGLGVLEGDKLLGAGDLGLDYIALSLYYRQGYASISFKGTEPSISPEEQETSFISSLSQEKEFTIQLRGEDIIVRPWVYRYKTARAVLFEAVCPLWARRLTDRVYYENSVEETFYKYALLAKASGYYLKNYVGLDKISIIDLEESYTSMILNVMDVSKLSRIIIHTPGPWGHPSFPGEFIVREFGVFLGDYINLTEYSLSKLEKAIVVSKKQESVVATIFPKYKEKIVAITNGIHLGRWMHPVLYEAVNKGEVNVDLLKKARQDARDKLYSLVRKYKDNVNVDGKMIIAWTRRLARYKRPYFVSRFIEENPDVNAFFIVAGKPHPRDSDGISYLKKFRDLDLKLTNVAYIPDYSMEVAKTILQGVDLLLFTPFPGWEACGTSYMKAMVNGVPVLSSRDGGVPEVVEDGYNSWLFGSEVSDFINIYTDQRAREIDEKDYSDFRNKLLWIIDMFNRDPSRYWEVAFNSLKTTPEKVDIKRALKKYYIQD